MPPDAVSTGQQQRDPLIFVVLLIVAVLSVLALFRVSQPAPSPVVQPQIVQPAAPACPPAPSPCGPNRCPYRQALPFAAVCPYCRNKLVAVPPLDSGQTGSVVPALQTVVPSLQGVGAQAPATGVPKK